MPRALLLPLAVALLGALAAVEAVFVRTPCCSSYTHAGARFGPRLPWSPPGTVGELVHAHDCAGPAETILGKVAFVDRGANTFVNLVEACMAKGAIAVVVRDTKQSGDGENALVVMGPDHVSGIKIPSVFVSRSTGEDLEILLGGSTPVVVELFSADDVTLFLASLPQVLFSVLSFAMSLSLCIMCCRMRRFYFTRRHSADAPLLVINNQGLLEPLNSQPTIAAPESKPARPAVPLPYPVVGGSTRVAMLSQDPDMPGEPLAADKLQQEL